MTDLSQSIEALGPWSNLSFPSLEGREPQTGLEKDPLGDDLKVCPPPDRVEIESAKPIMSHWIYKSVSGRSFIVSERIDFEKQLRGLCERGDYVAAQLANLFGEARSLEVHISPAYHELARKIDLADLALSRLKSCAPMLLSSGPGALILPDIHKYLKRAFSYTHSQYLFNKDLSRTEFIGQVALLPEGSSSILPSILSLMVPVVVQPYQLDAQRTLAILVVAPQSLLSESSTFMFDFIERIEANLDSDISTDFRESCEAFS